jgi:hypothetical protein
MTAPSLIDDLDRNNRRGQDDGRRSRDGGGPTCVGSWNSDGSTGSFAGMSCRS